jgi:hypothetical protein
MCPQHSLTACSHLPGCGFFQLDSTMLPPPTIPSSKLTSSIDSTPAIDIISDAAISSDSVTFPTVPVTSAALPSSLSFVSTYFPYMDAVSHLEQLTNRHTPREKLQCLSSVSQEICICVDDYYKAVNDERSKLLPPPEQIYMYMRCFVLLCYMFFHTKFFIVSVSM